MKKCIATLLLAALLLAVSACAQSGRGAVKAPDEDVPLTFCLGSRPATLDPAQYPSAGDAAYVVNTFAGLTGYRLGGDGEPELAPELCRALPVAQENEDGKPVYTFELRDGLKWSDGTPLTAADFVYAWNRALTLPDADQAYLFEVIDGYDAGTLNVTASDDGGTLTVVLAEEAPYFLQLCASPVFMPVQQAAAEASGSWASGADSFVCSGAYVVGELTDERLVLTKNAHYWDAANVVSDTLVFDFSDDPSAALQGFLGSKYALVGTLPSSQLAELREKYPDEYHADSRLGTYSLCFNIHDSALANFTQDERARLRTALSLLIDRNYICDEIAKAGQVPANSYVPSGISDADGGDFTARNGASGTGGGYFSTDAADYAANCAEAVSLLRQVAASSGAFTVSEQGVCSGFPELSYLTSDSAGHVEIAEYLKTLCAGYGITLTVSAQDMTTFLASRAEGNYSIVRHSWSADYDDPVSFLALWTTGAGSNEIGFGRGAHADYAGYSITIDGETRTGLTWAESYDALLYTICSTDDLAQRYDLMHQAETLLMRTGAVCPLYEYTSVYLLNANLQGVFTDPTGAKYFLYARLVEK